MNGAKSVLMGSLAAIGCLLGAYATPAAAQSLSKAEQIYADLAKLSPEERTAKILEGAKREGKISIIQTMREELGNGQIRLFAQRYPFIKVDWTASLGSQDGAERMMSEEIVGRHLTDVLNAAVPDMADLLAANMIARAPTPATQRILPQYRSVLDPESRWMPSFWDVNGMVYNTNLVPPDRVPKQWSDLCDPYFKGNFSFDPVLGRIVAGFSIMFGDKTTDMFKCLGANKPIIQRGYSQRFLLMEAGDHAIVADSYLYQVFAAKKRNANSPTAVVPNLPMLAAFCAVGINRQTENPYASALFLDWIVTDEAQNYLAANLRGPTSVKHPFLPEDAKFIVMPNLPKAQLDPLVTLWRQEIEGSK